MTPEPTKHCRKCDTTKPHSEFHRSRCRRDGLESLCKPCRNAGRREAEARARAAGRTKPLGDARHRGRAEIAAKALLIKAELTRDRHRTDFEIGAVVGAGRGLVARVRGDWELDRMMASSRHRPPPPTPRTMRAIACATTDELRLFHPSYVARARQLGVIA